MLKTSLNTFGNVFGHFENWKFSCFLKFFDFSTLQGALGEIFHRQKYLEACSKHVWLLLGTFLGHFEKLKVFPVFWNFSKFRRSRVHWAIFSKKKLQQNNFKTCLDTFRIVFGHFWNFEFLSLFFRINQKNYLKACSKRFWTFLGIYLGFLKKNESFSIFLNFYQVSTLQRALGKIFFQKNTSKQFQHLFEKLLRTFLDTFRNSIFFDFFSNFYKFWSPGCTGQEKFGKNHLRRNLDTFGNVFRDFEKLNFFPFFEIFRFLYPPGCTGRTFSPEKIPRSMLKTSLNTFGNVFGHFENWKFSCFLKFFDFSTLQGALGEIFHRQKYLEACSKHVWLLLGTFLGHFEKLKVFPVFWNFSKFRRSRVHWAIFSKKKLQQNNFKTCLDTFRIVFGHFWNFEFLSLFFRINQKNYLKACSKRFWTFLGIYLGFLKKNESFSIFLNFYQVSTLQRALGKIFFQKNTSKQFQHLFEKLLRTFLDTFRNSIFFDFFSNFYKFWSPGCTGQEKFGKNHLRRNLDTFGNVFRDFEKLNFFPFFEIFRFLYPPGCTGRTFSPEKIPRSMLKTNLNTFGNVFGHFENWKFSSFLKFFDFSTLQGALGEIFHRQKYLEACSKHVWLLLGTFFGHFEKLKVFPIFWNFSKFRRSRVHWAIFSKKNYLKTISKLVWTLLGSFLDTFEISNFCRFFFRINQKNYLTACSKWFWTFLGMYLGFLKKNESFSIFLTFYQVSTLQRALGKIFFQKSTSKQFQHLFEKLLRTFLDTFRNSIFFDFFFEFLQVLISRLHWSRKVRKKNHLRRNLDTFGNVFRDFVKLNFFPFFEIFRFLYPPGCNGRIFLPEKIPRSMLKTSLNTFGNVFGHFENWKFSSFLKFFDFSTLQRALGEIFHRQKYLEACSKHVWLLLGTFFGHFEKLKVFPIFWNFSKFRRSRVHWAIFSKKNYLKTISKLVWTLLGSFLDTFEISNFCRFFFRINQKNYLRACSKRFWTFLGMYLGFLKKNESFSIFLTFYQVSTLQRALGKIFFQKSTSKQFQHLFEKLLRTFLDTFRNSIFFDFFFEFLQVLISRLHWSRKVRKKITSEEIWTLLETFFGIL